MSGGGGCGGGANGMKQIEERHVAGPIELMVWCNRMDLLALSNCRGEVQLHRLNWQRVWSLAPPADSSAVRGMIWRPDGKVLAIGYSCGTTRLVDVEDKEILHSTGPTEGRGGVACLSWGQKGEKGEKGEPEGPEGAYRIARDSSLFLPPPPSINPNYKKAKDDAKSEPKGRTLQTRFNALLVGYENGRLHMSVFGLFPCGAVDLGAVFGSDRIRPVDAKLSDDFSRLHVYARDERDGRLKLAVLDTEALAAYSDELHSLASKHVETSRLLAYIDQTMVSIVEAWEQILLEMDSKLEKYAAQVPEGGISADFLDLLMLGVPSTELELFLLRDLTTKGLKKFGTSVELSYSTIQKLVLKQLNTVGHDITYHLAELRGLSRITHRYQILGLEEDTVTEAIISSGAFINKCLELQQVIDHAMKNYKAFFRWLYTVIVRLMDEHVPAEIAKITQQDLTYIAEFLLNFDKVGSCNTDPSKEGTSNQQGEKKGRFNLERLGQYLTDKELTIIPEDDNPWKHFLSENNCIAKHPGIVKCFKRFSLVQQQNHLKEAISKVFNCSEESLASKFSPVGIVNCIGSDLANLRVSQMNSTEDQTILTAFTDSTSPQRGFYFVEVSYGDDSAKAKLINFYFKVCGNMNDSKLEYLDGSNLNVLDVQFYSTEVLSILLEHPNDECVSSFVQFPIKLARMKAREFKVGVDIDFLNEAPSLNAFDVLDVELGACKLLDKIAAGRIAVSGGRKVAVVLSKGCRKVRIFEMEVDGEDDDDELHDTTPQSHSTTQHSDNSQNMSMNDSIPMNVCRSNDENPTEPADINVSDGF